jgi:DNA-binding MarR family transcriptional regulator/GNAT superfamily N-acetyltransferase
MSESSLDASIQAVRRFSRFYTKRLGLLQEGLLGSPFSLTEARVIYELAQRKSVPGTELQKELGLDAGYLSRILKKLEDLGLVERERSKADRRQNLISLTRSGRAQFRELDRQSQNQVAKLLQPLSAGDRSRLVAATRAIEEVLSSEPPHQPPIVLRQHRPGDIGWVIERHGVLYAQEYGWNEQVEALTAEIGAQFLKSFDPERERAWIAERGGERVGAVFLVRETDEIARLRLLLVEPAARGQGLGNRLVQECIRFAREKGYRKLTLWTNHVLTAARKIYEGAGFRLVKEEPHRKFGPELIGQHWELAL